MSPWIGRNLWVTGKFAFVTQREGAQLFKRPGNRNPHLNLEEWCQQYESLAGDRSAQQRFALLTSLDYIIRNPVKWIEEKSDRFWEVLLTVHSEAFRRIRYNIYGSVVPRYTFAFLWVMGIGFLLLTTGWIVGIVSAPPSSGRSLLFLWLGYSAAFSVVLALLPRVRLVILGSLAIFSGYFWGQPLTASHRLRRPKVLLVFVVLLALLPMYLNVRIYSILEVSAPLTCVEKFSRD